MNFHLPFRRGFMEVNVELVLFSGGVRLRKYSVSWRQSTCGVHFWGGVTWAMFVSYSRVTTLA